MKSKEKCVHIKTCPVCGTEFGATHGNQRYCSPECRKKARSEYYHKYYLDHRDHILKRQRKYCNENKEKVYERQRRWREANPDKMHARCVRDYQKNKKKKKERALKWRRQNPDRVKMWRIEWERNNPDKIAFYNEKNKAHKYAKRHHITENYCRTHNDCQYCPYPYEVCLFE